MSEHGQLDILFNNAGTLAAGNIGDIREEDFDQLLKIHLKAPMFLTQAAMPHLKATRGCIGQVINYYWTIGRKIDIVGKFLKNISSDEKILTTKKCKSKLYKKVLIDLSQGCR